MNRIFANRPNQGNAAAPFGSIGSTRPTGTTGWQAFADSKRGAPWRLMSLVCAVCCALHSGGLVFAGPFVPRDGAQVLERLRSSPLDPDARELRALRARLSVDPNNLGLASQFARKAIERSWNEADPRYLGRAQ